MSPHNRVNVTGAYDARMRLIDPFLTELDAEARSTENVLARVPVDRADWRPHAKSMTLGQLASHIATLPRRMSELLDAGTFELTMARPPSVSADASLVETFRANQKMLCDFVDRLDDETARAKFILTKNGEVVMKMSRLSALRSIVMNHTYHHRGQLTVYLRLLDVPLPAIYGTSADEAM